MKISAVLFDMNGVIVNDEPLHLAAFQNVMQEKGQILTEQQYKDHFAGKTDKDGFKSYLSSIGKDYDINNLMRSKAQAYLDMAQDELTPHDGVIEFINGLADKAIPIALVTSSLRTEAETVLRTFGITELFQVIITADEIQRGKPDPQGYLMAAETLEVEPTNCVVIEDAPSGIQAAKAAGMKCVAVLNTHSKYELAGADLLLEALSTDYLQSMD